MSSFFKDKVLLHTFNAGVKGFPSKLFCMIKGDTVQKDKYRKKTRLPLENCVDNLSPALGASRHRVVVTARQPV
jgi:hypothetical protein